MDDSEQDGWMNSTRFFTKRGFKFIRHGVLLPWAKGVLYKDT